ncbi:Hypothetical protein KVN_LOCUS40 [uncultured virus]|nr:Hypothetical protein KVN_LOCUS40 [uncultured virus]
MFPTKLKVLSINFQKRFVSNYPNGISISHKLKSINDKILSEINNKFNKIEPKYLNSFKNEKLGDVCKMNNKNLAKHHKNINDKFVFSYDLFGNHNYSKFIELFNNYENYLISKDSKYLIKNINILKFDSHVDFFQNFIKIHIETNSNILNKNEINHFTKNLEVCFSYVKNQITNYQKYSSILEEHINHKNVIKSDEIKFNKLNNYNLLLENYLFHHNLIPLKFSIKDFLEIEQNYNNEHKKYYFDSINEFIKYLHYDHFFSYISISDLINNKNFAILNDSDRTIIKNCIKNDSSNLNLFKNYQLFSPKFKSYIMDKANDDFFEMHNNLLNLWYNIKIYRNFLSNKHPENEWKFDNSISPLIDFIKKNKNVINHTKLFDDTDFYILNKQIKENIEISNKIKYKINNLKNHTNNFLELYRYKY